MLPADHLLLSLALCASSAAATFADGGDIPDHHAFALDGRGARLVRIAARAYLESARAADLYPVEESGDRGRPAGPRDEPPPPEWPDDPDGLVLCLRVEGAIRACEGELGGPSSGLAAVATLLAERLAAAGGSNRRRALRPEEIPGATIEAAFALEVEVVDRDRVGKKVGEAGIDLSARGLRIEGSGGSLLLMPGEVRSLRKALRLARRAGAVPRFGKPARIEAFTPAAAGSGPLKGP